MKLIELSKGLHAKVSDEDYDFLMQWKWTASLESRDTKWYAIRWSRKTEHGEGKRYKIRMHRVLMGLGPKGSEVVDHNDDDGLNNQRDNLTVCTQKQNMDKVPGWKGGEAFKAAVTVALVTMVLLGCGPKDADPIFVEPEMVPYFERFAEKVQASTQGIWGIFIPQDLPTIARCVIHANGDRAVEVDPSVWARFNDDEREEMIFHELGHCALDLGHTTDLNSEGCPVSIMFPFAFAKSLCYTDHRDDYFLQLRGQR